METTKNSEHKDSASERTGLIVNLTLKTEAKQFNRGKAKLKAEKHSAAIVILMDKNTAREGSPGVAKIRSRKRNVSGLSPEPVKVT